MEDSIDVSRAITASEPIPSYRPDAKARRYDRQLRLWASAGQRSLESARILLVGVDAAGCQALKNLVLPGIAHFTILSPVIATPQLVATNFFLHPEGIASSAAQAAVRFLKELNPAVTGEAREDDVEELLDSDPSFFTSFTLVICSNVEPSLELRLADLLWETSASVGGSDIPLICIRSSGFVGRVEIQLREHCVVDTHPDSTHTLRIDEPFQALELYARSLDMTSMDSMEHSHVPWVVLLVRAGSLWKERHGGKLPDTSEERDEFKKMLRGEMRHADEENFEQAVAQAYRFSMKSDVPSDLRHLLEMESVANVSSSSKNLHILLHALSIYLRASPHLVPTSPTLPDMHSSTSSYITLQNLYKGQYRADLERFREILSGVLEEADMTSDTIPDEEVEGFVKFTGGVGIITGTSLRDRKEIKGSLRETIGEVFSDVSGDDFFLQRELALHLALLACERCCLSRNRWPGSAAETDIASEARDVEAQVRSLLTAVIGPDKLGLEMPEELVHCIAEVTRGGFSCLPTTAAFLGGVVAQEAIKLVTNQYTPLDNTVIIDLVKSASEKFKF